MWLGFLVVGCQPALASEYACARAECPPGWECWADGNCRDHTPEYEVLESCDGASGCSTRFCAVSVDPMAMTANGYCSTICDDSDDCTIGEQGSICVAGACRPRCQRMMDCPTGTQCRFGIPDLDTQPMTAYCFTMRNETLGGTRSCLGNTMDQCQLPGWCLQPVAGPGVCSMLCETTGRGEAPEECPQDSECVQVMNDDMGLCLKPCTSAGDCTDPSLECAAPTTGGGDTYCIPAGWVDQLPVAEDYRRTPMMPPP